jgi:hypothetical protein
MEMNQEQAGSGGEPLGVLGFIGRPPRVSWKQEFWTQGPNVRDSI